MSILLSLLKVANAKMTPEKIDVVIANLRQRGTSKPRTLKTLTSTICSIFQNQLTKEELASLLKGLQAKGFIAVNETTVTYALPESTD